MGLSRRGTKLLRLGGGLRDCCCRPEQPEECFCPSVCRYYWSWGGNSRLAQQELIDSFCNGVVDVLSEFSNDDTYGLCNVEASQNRQFASIFSSKSGLADSGNLLAQCRYLLFNYRHRLSGPTAKSAITDTLLGEFAVTREAQYQTDIIVNAYPFQRSINQAESTWAAEVLLVQKVFLADPFNNRIVTVYSKSFLATVFLPATCVSSASYECEPEEVARKLHYVLGDAELSISGEGATFGEQLTPWSDLGGTDLGETAWHVAGDYPLTSAVTVTMKAKESCTTAPATAVILTSGSSYEVPEGTTTIKAWSIGSGGVGETGKAGGGAGFTYFNIPGNAGGIAYKTWNSVGGTISYSVGDARPASTIADGEATTVTYDGVTITGGGGTSSMPTNLRYPNNYVASTFSGGDGGAAGGRGDLGQWGDYGQSGGAVGGNGIRQACGRLPATDVSGLFAAVTEAAANNGIDKAVEDCGLEPAVGSGAAEDKFGLPFAAGYGGGGIWTAGEYAGTPSGSGAVVLLFE